MRIQLLIFPKKSLWVFKQEKPTFETGEKFEPVAQAQLLL